jgi:DNA-binding NarL/FixJ family response regulator
VSPSSSKVDQCLLLRFRYRRPGHLEHRDGAPVAERQVMALVVSGLLNKQVGGELGISEINVKKHRGRMMGR